MREIRNDIIKRNKREFDLDKKTETIIRKILKMFQKENEVVEFCRVCGETNSASWHCGTITCEACKKFFLRNVNGYESAKLECVRNNECVITRQTRTDCPHCRFKKCIQIGMKHPSDKSGDIKPVCYENLACVVCGESASGVHFGALTCEGCKV
jgi:hypothetical protein